MPVSIATLCQAFTPSTTVRTKFTDACIAGIREQSLADWTALAVIAWHAVVAVAIVVAIGAKAARAKFAIRLQEATCC